MDVVSTKITNTLGKNMSINSHRRRVRYKIYCYILHTVLSVIIILMIITIFWYHYVKHRSKQEKYWCTDNIKMENNEYCNVCIENRWHLKILIEIIF